MQTLADLRILISLERLADLWDRKQFLKQASGPGIQKATIEKKKGGVLLYFNSCWYLFVMFIREIEPHARFSDSVLGTE